MSPIIALHSVNNNNTVYVFDPLIPFLSHTGSGNEKTRLWLTLFCEVLGHPHATQVKLQSHMSTDEYSGPGQPRTAPDHDPG